MKKDKKISINLTQEQYQLIEWLARETRRSISEVAALILIDNAQLLFNEMQVPGKWYKPQFIPHNKPIK